MIKNCVRVICFAAAAVLPALAACSDEGRNCGTVGCSASFTFEMPLTVPFEAVHTLSLDVCRNSKCRRVSFDAIVEPPPVGGGFSGSDTVFDTADQLGNVFVEGIVWRNEPAKFRLEASYRPSNQENLENGDVYTVTLTNESGESLSSFEIPVTYEDLYPNTRECAPLCRGAVYDHPDGGSPLNP